MPSGLLTSRARTQARSEIEFGNLDRARVMLEAERERKPRDTDVRVDLGEVYYRIARDALDREGDEARYLTYLERAVNEFVTALEIDPGADRPHFFMGVNYIYRGEPWKALRGFNNARKLRPDPVAYTNIGETYVYLGHLHKARRWTELGLEHGAPYAYAVFNEMLIHWREGDVRRARRDFAYLKERAPDLIRTINVARLPEEPRSFEDFAGYCCGSPACGPYLVEQCRDLGVPVLERQISEEAVLRELRLEIETRKRLRKIYEQRKELDLEIEEDGDGTP